MVGGRQFGQTNKRWSGSRLVATRPGFIRVNVHYDVMAAAEGLVTGEASETLRQREALGVDVKILADVLVKHAVPLGNQDLGLMARETAQRGLADGLIISGPATGLPTLRSDVAQARSAVPRGSSWWEAASPSPTHGNFWPSPMAPSAAPASNKTARSPNPLTPNG